MHYFFSKNRATYFWRHLNAKWHYSNPLLLNINYYENKIIKQSNSSKQ